MTRDDARRPPRSSRPPRAVSTPAALILLILAGLAAFGRVSRFEFTAWDDDDTVVHNPDLNPPTFSSLLSFWSHPRMGLYIPVTYTAWACVANASHTEPQSESVAPPTDTPVVLDPRLFHTVNLALHILAAWLVFLILRELVRADVPALAGAMLFLLHPVQVEPVAWVSGLKDVLFGVLSLTAIWQYIRLARASRSDPQLPNRQWWGRYLFATAAFVLAMLAKPTAIVVPALVIVLDLLILRRPLRTIMQQQAGPWLVLAIPIALVARWAQATHDIGVIVSRTPLLKRPLVAADALAFYLNKLIWPATLSFDYGRTPQRVLAQGLRGMTWIAPLLVLAILIPLRYRARTIVAAAIISLLVLLPVLGFVPFDFQAYSTVADHYLYLAMLGPALALAWILAKRFNAVTMTIAAIVLLALGIRTFNQAPYWRTSNALFEHAREVNPSSYASFNCLAGMAIESRDYRSAIDLATVAIQLNPAFSPAYITRGSAFAQSGNIAAGIADCRKALDLAPNHPQALGNLAALLAMQGRFSEALPYAKRAVESDPGSLSARMNLAALYVTLGDEAHARPHLDWILQRSPDNAAARRLLSQLHPPSPPATTPSP
jgi:tetratricopeptide (TPR) repeat protein